MMGMKVNFPRLMMLAVVAAVVAFIGERALGGEGGSGSLLLTMVFWIGLAEGCVALMAAAEIAHATWHRPVFTRMVSAYPMLLVMVVVFAVRATQLDQYPWAHDAGMWLNKPFFIIRHVVMLLLVWAVARQFTTVSLAGLNSRRLWAVIYCFLFMTHMSMIGFEWVMSLEKPWFSTLYGAWFMVGAWLSGICACAVMLYRLRSQFDDGLRYTQKSIGALIFGFATFWAYFYFSQLIVIWYGNLPEEVGYLARRIGYHTSYWFIARLIFGLVWVIPFTVLLSRANKTRPRVTLWLAMSIYTGLILEFWLMIQPVVHVNVVLGVVYMAVMGFIFAAVMRSGSELLPRGGTMAASAAPEPAHH